MSNRQLAPNILKSTINYELYKDPGKIRKLKCEKSTDYIVKQFVYLRNDLKIIIRAINQLFDNIGYYPSQHITTEYDILRPMVIQQDNTEYNVNIQWPNEYNRTHICTIKGYFHYESDTISLEGLNNLDICITIQIGILYNGDLPDTTEKIDRFIFIDGKPKLYQDMVCNINRMMLYPKKYKIPQCLQDLITNIHTCLVISHKL